MEFKLHPVKSAATRESLDALPRDVCGIAWEIWRQIEGNRLGLVISTPSQDANDGNKCPETSRAKNALIRLRAFGWRGWLLGRMFRYPRES
ncbi:MAG: hypothetical protein ACK5VX_06900, partial [Akkermansiaceae bacterium]